MISKETTTFEINGKLMKFNFDLFLKLFEKYQQNNRLTVTALQDELSEKINVTTYAVKNWRQRNNGPGSLDIIQDVAKFLNISDWKMLLKEVEGGKKMERLTDREKTAVKKIYDVCIWFLNKFEKSDGFNSYWHDFVEKGSSNPKLDIEELVDSLMQNVFLVIDQEYFDLRGCEIYNELSEFISEDLQNVYSGKLSYAYRFEAIPYGNPTTFDDYGKAMLRLNNIIDQYV